MLYGDLVISFLQIFFCFNTNKISLEMLKICRKELSNIYLFIFINFKSVLVKM